MRTIILGGGMAGVSLAHVLDESRIVLEEEEPRPMGIASGLPYAWGDENPDRRVR